MKKILITGKNSYIGTSLEKWLLKEPEKYSIDTISVKENSWEEKDFGKYDVVFHVAGIAHVSTNPKMEDLYYRVNRDLTIEVAKKARAEGVKQFIFMSSIIVYGDNNNSKQIIDRNTIPKPSNFYGKSKLQAEDGIRLLETDDFKVAILRPPMIYGKGSKGNYPILAKFARLFPIFPDLENKRSMLYIDNLSEFIKLIIKNTDTGVFFPQNQEYVSTSSLVKTIRRTYQKKVYLTPSLNFVLNKVIFKIKIVNKIFGNLCYDKDISIYKEKYNLYDFEESIKKTEGNIL